MKICLHIDLILMFLGFNFFCSVLEISLHYFNELSLAVFDRYLSQGIVHSSLSLTADMFNMELIFFAGTRELQVGLP